MKPQVPAVQIHGALCGGAVRQQPADESGGHLPQARPNPPQHRRSTAAVAPPPQLRRSPQGAAQSSLRFDIVSRGVVDGSALQHTRSRCVLSGSVGAAGGVFDPGMRILCKSDWAAADRQCAGLGGSGPTELSRGLSALGEVPSRACDERSRAGCGSERRVGAALLAASSSFCTSTRCWCCRCRWCCRTRAPGARWMRAGLPTACCTGRSSRPWLARRPSAWAFS